MKKLIIFDLDGTLIDTLDDLKNSVNYALEKYGYPLRTKEDIRKAIGNGVAVLVARSLEGGDSNPDYPEILRIFKDHYLVHSRDLTGPYPGIKNMLKEVRSAGFLTAVATNKVHEIAVELINDEFPNSFNYILGDVKGRPNKPAPDMIEKILADLGVSKEDSIYVGDTNVDEQTALNSKLDYVLVSYGFRTREEILNTCVGKTIVDSVEELQNYLKTLA